MVSYSIDEEEDTTTDREGALGQVTYIQDFHGEVVLITGQIQEKKLEDVIIQMMFSMQEAASYVLGPLHGSKNKSVGNEKRIDPRWMYIEQELVG
ncbi:hypothetical protein L873DRAFT_1881819 [Choiromyces venosus 120613-1]|uniref:Uncharacterized protein n=1 Tax=Choiromyces venosus 120613-1 TaxID=1336337 RepID=A0A3N4IV26_9PEZI|nr:hypothetical protein L873DRAFT_1881819 [Choiromyces venosus 120613-1]